MLNCRAAWHPAFSVGSEPHAGPESAMLAFILALGLWFSALLAKAVLALIVNRIENTPAEARYEGTKRSSKTEFYLDVRKFVRSGRREQQLKLASTSARWKA